MRKAIQGFTVIEIMIVVSIIGILSSIGIVSYVNVQKNSRDQQRLSSATIITEAIEKYYDKNGAYPTCDQITSLGIDNDAMFAPKADKNMPAIECSNELTNGGVNDVFAYKIDSNGAWQFQYRNEKNGNSVKSIASRRTPPTIAWETPVVSANSKSSSEIVLEWSPILHATSYKYRYFKKCASTEINSPSLGNINKNTVTSLDSGTKYCFSISGTKDTRSSPFSNKAVAITAPDKPTLSKPTLMGGKIKVDISGGTCNGIDLTSMYSVSSKKGNGSWSEFSEWTSASAFDSGIIPNPGVTYSFKAKARCTVSATGPNSVASAESNPIDFLANMPTYNLTVVANPSAAVSSTTGSGAYLPGEVIAINYVANVYYSFVEWSTGCSNSTTMPSHDITCTARFNYNPPSIPAVPSAPTVSHNIENVVKGCGTILKRDCDGVVFKWNNPCPASTSTIYEYKYTNNFTSGDTNNNYSDNSFVASTSSTFDYEDKKYNMEVRAKCGNAAGYSTWGTWGEHEYRIPITDPKPVVFSDVSRTTYQSNPAIYMTAKTSCGRGSSLWGIADQWTSYSGGHIFWYNPTRNPSWIDEGWFGTGDRNTWLLGGYNKVGSGIAVTSLLFNDDISSSAPTGTTPIYLPSGVKIKLRTDFYCVSDTTGIRNPTIQYSVSDEKILQ